MVEQPGDVVVLLPTRGTREQDCEGFRRNCSVYREELVWTEQLATVQLQSDKALVAVDGERGEEEAGAEAAGEELSAVRHVLVRVHAVLEDRGRSEPTNSSLRA